MTKIYNSLYHTLYSAVRSNPLPYFRATPHDLSITTKEDVPAEYTHLLGLDCGRRVLPYSIQDRYSRDLKETDLKSIVIENDYLKATFLPTLGGRLISLFDKTQDKELLYENKSIQLANLANRNAWFAGGIEWNIGQYGHSFLTCDDVNFSVVKTNKEEFLRLHLYERCKKLYFQIDFHLPEDAHVLYAYTKVHNLFNQRTSLYYWTNIAVEESEETRVFASSNKAFYLDPKPKNSLKEYGYMEVPTLPIEDSIDASYPANFKSSFEYFFTCNHDKIPYEVAIQKDGYGFFEASSNPLNYRKMFCWGRHQGGLHWQDFLSPSRNTTYVEIQGGLAASQLHGLFLDSNSSLDWLQVFGSIKVDDEKAHAKDYTLAKAEVIKTISPKLEELALYEKIEEYRAFASTPGKALHSADNWGALEAELSGITLPCQFNYSALPIAAWSEYLETGVLKGALYSLPPVTGLDWINTLSKVMGRESSEEKAQRLYYLAIAEAEEERLAEAEENFKQCLQLKPHYLVYRNLAKLKEKLSDTKASIVYYKKAIALELNLFLAEEYFSLLVRANEIEDAKAFYNSLPFSSDTLIIDRARLALLEKDTATIKDLIFNSSFANIKEGDVILSDLWIAYHHLLNKEVPPVPKALDFRQVEL
ncbi:MAG: DUF5107 domain-containing protein [Spirochaetales bacterium]|nr:DUF5107 domain-containing protein [Spirochaetales bacterium]